jgi:hypothetical protein
VVEHVFPVRFLSVVFSAGRRLWVIDAVGWRFESAFALCASSSIGQSSSQTSTLAPCPLTFDGPKLWVIACCRFESDLLHSMGQ